MKAILCAILLMASFSIASDLSWLKTSEEEWVKDEVFAKVKGEQSAKLCFTTDKDERKGATYHTLCNNKGPTVTIAKFDNGKIIGGYAGASWMNKQDYVTTSNSFLFSISNSFIHEMISGKESRSMYDYSAYGPTFGGGHDLNIKNDMNTGYCNLGDTYQCRTGAHDSDTCRNDFCGTYDGWKITKLETFYFVEVHDPCERDNGGCLSEATCTNDGVQDHFDVTVKAICTCPVGKEGDGTTNCNAINPCNTDNGGCISEAFCENESGTAICTCPSGKVGDGKENCTFINPCETDNGGCISEAVCTNESGTAICTCPSGKVGDGIKNCENTCESNLLLLEGLNEKCNYLVLLKSYKNYYNFGAAGILKDLSGLMIGEDIKKLVETDPNEESALATSDVHIGESWTFVDYMERFGFVVLGGFITIGWMAFKNEKDEEEYPLLLDA